MSLTTFGDLLTEAERALRLPDAAQRRRTAHRRLRARPRGGEWLQQATLAIHASHPRSGPTPHSIANPRSPWMRAGFSPEVTSSCPAVSTPMHQGLTSRGPVFSGQLIWWFYAAWWCWW